MEKFSKSRARLLIENPYFQEDFFTGSFISGLKESIPHWVSATNTTTVEEAFPLARCAPLLLMKLWADRQHHEKIDSIQYLKQAFLGPIALVTIVGLPRAPMAPILFPSLIQHYQLHLRSGFSFYFHMHWSIYWTVDDISTKLGNPIGKEATDWTTFSCSASRWPPSVLRFWTDRIHRPVTILLFQSNLGPCSGKNPIFLWKHRLKEIVKKR